MKVAIAQWQDRVSPVFDVANEILVSEIRPGKERRSEVVSIKGAQPMERARALKDCGTQVLICGAISRPMEMTLTALGIQVIPFTCGEVEEVLEAFRCGRLKGTTFLMPGCGKRRRSRSSQVYRDQRS
jgi:predicted Fe-Mo cluster-binding NifX family protein